MELPNRIINNIVKMTLAPPQDLSICDIVHSQNLALACKTFNQFYNKSNRKYKASIYLYEYGLQIVTLSQGITKLHDMQHVIDLTKFFIATIIEQKINVSIFAIENTLKLLQVAYNNLNRQHYHRQANILDYILFIQNQITKNIKSSTYDYRPIYYTHIALRFTRCIRQLLPNTENPKVTIETINKRRFIFILSNHKSSIIKKLGAFIHFNRQHIVSIQASQEWSRNIKESIDLNTLYHLDFPKTIGEIVKQMNLS